MLSSGRIENRAFRKLEIALFITVNGKSAKNDKLAERHGKENKTQTHKNKQNKMKRIQKKYMVKQKVRTTKRIDEFE